MCLGGEWYILDVFGCKMMVVEPPPPATLLDRIGPLGAEVALRFTRPAEFGGLRVDLL